MWILHTVLDRICISGMEKFNAIIKGARATISSKECEQAEVGIQQFVKQQIANVPITESIILILQCFERLNLECLCLDHRYLKVAEMLEHEMFLLKDVYNEERGSPIIPRNLPPVAGRIMWIRSIFQKIDEPMKVLKKRPCVLAHKKAQKTVRYYNYMNGIICHYEMTYHKAWFDYCEEVRCLLNSPILSCGKQSAEYVVNLYPAIMQMVKETKWMWKLKLEVPNIAAVVTYCKTHILNPAKTLKYAIQCLDRLRSSITPVFINIKRFRLQEVSVLLKPVLSTVTWLSENIEDFVKSVEKPVKVLVGSARNFRGVPEPSVYFRPLMINAWAQTTDHDIYACYQLERVEQQSKREKELEERIKVLEENLKVHANLLSQIHATSALIGHQASNSSPHNEQLNTANVCHNNVNSFYSTISSTPQISPRTFSSTNSGRTTPINSVINPHQQLNCTPAESVKYTIIAEGTGNLNGEPIEIQLAEEDGALNLNNSADSGRLKICLAGEENVNIKTTLNDDKTIIKQPLDSTTPNEKKRRSSSSVLKTPKIKRNICTIAPTIKNVNTPPQLTGINNDIMYNTTAPTMQNVIPSSQLTGINNNMYTTASTMQNAIPSPQLTGTNNDMVSLGPNNTRIHTNIYHNINWSSASVATRKLLMALFDRKTLATHSMTGKPSPAFKDLNKPRKKMLNPLITSDIVFTVTRKCNVTEKEVRSAITTKCADENKMMKAKMEKRMLMEEANKENLG